MKTMCPLCWNERKGKKKKRNEMIFTLKEKLNQEVELIRQEFGSKGKFYKNFLFFFFFFY